MDSILNFILKHDAILALIGVLVGYFVHTFIERYKVRRSLIESTSNLKAEKFFKLWKICKKANLDSTCSRVDKYLALLDWYNNGGGLFLSFKASERFRWARILLEISLLDNGVNLELIKSVKNYQYPSVINDNPNIKPELISDQLSWLRTELKRTLRSYNNFEVRTELSCEIGRHKNVLEKIFSIIKMKKRYDKKVINEIKNRARKELNEKCDT